MLGAGVGAAAHLPPFSDSCDSLGGSPCLDSYKYLPFLLLNCSFPFPSTTNFLQRKITFDAGITASLPSTTVNRLRLYSVSPGTRMIRRFWRKNKAKKDVKQGDACTAPVSANKTRSGHGAEQGSSSSIENKIVTKDATKKQLRGSDDDHEEAAPVYTELDAESSKRPKASGLQPSMPSYMLAQSSGGQQGHDGMFDGQLFNNGHDTKITDHEVGSTSHKSSFIPLSSGKGVQVDKVKGLFAKLDTGDAEGKADSPSLESRFTQRHGGEQGHHKLFDVASTASTSTGRNDKDAKFKARTPAPGSLFARSGSGKHGHDSLFGPKHVDATTTSTGHGDGDAEYDDDIPTPGDPFPQLGREEQDSGSLFGNQDFNPATTSTGHGNGDGEEDARKTARETAIATLALMMMVRNRTMSEQRARTSIWWKPLTPPRKPNPRIPKSPRAGLWTRERENPIRSLRKQSPRTPRISPQDLFVSTSSSFFFNSPLSPLLLFSNYQTLFNFNPNPSPKPTTCPTASPTVTHSTRLT